VRNRGTIGGAAAHADPASDMPAVMLVLDAEFVLRSKRGILPLAKRSVRPPSFFQGRSPPRWARGELLTEIVLPGPPKGAAWRTWKHMAAASGLRAGRGGVRHRAHAEDDQHIKVATTGVGDSHRLRARGAGARRHQGEPEIVARVADRAFEGVEIQGDIHAPADYRRALASSS